MRGPVTSQSLSRATCDIITALGYEIANGHEYTRLLDEDPKEVAARLRDADYDL